MHFPLGGNFRLLPFFLSFFLFNSLYTYKAVLNVPVYVPEHM